MRLGLVTEIRPHASEEFDEDALWEAVDMRDGAQDKAPRYQLYLTVFHLFVCMFPGSQHQVSQVFTRTCTI